MRASTKRIISFFLSIVFLIAAFVIYASFLRPEYMAVNVLRGELATKSGFVEQQEAILMQVKDLVSRYESARALEESISLALPREEATASLLNQVVTNARDARLSIGAVTFAAAPLKVTSGVAQGGAPKRFSTKVGTLAMTIDAVGSYESMKSFLQAIERNIRVMDVGELRANPKNPNAIEYRMKINTYYQVQ